MAGHLPSSPRGELDAARGRPDAAARSAGALSPEALAALLDLARALSAATDRGELAAIAVEEVVRLGGAVAAEVTEPRGADRLAVVAEGGPAVDPGRPGAARCRRVSAVEREVLDGAAPVWLSSAADARARFGAEPLAPGEAWALLPLAADERLVGILTIAFAAARELDEPSRALLVEVAAACGAALARGSLFARERARAEASEGARADAEARHRRAERLVVARTHLFERERFARARAEAETAFAVGFADAMERAQRLTAALAHAGSAREVMARLAALGPAALGARRVTLTWDAPEGRAEAEVLRTGAAAWLDADELATRFPATWDALVAIGATSWLGVPVGREGEPCGVLAAAFAGESACAPEERARLVFLASECASVLAERLARRAAAATRRAAIAAGRVEHVAEYEDLGPDGAGPRVLGVFSSEEAARAALRAVRGEGGTVRAWITSWAVDVPRRRARVYLPRPGP